MHIYFLTNLARARPTAMKFGDSALLYQLRENFWLRAQANKSMYMHLFKFAKSNACS